MEKNKTEVVQRYVDLLSNSGFKAVFGDRNNKDVVMSVINMLLPEGKRVEEIEYAPTEQQGQQETNKEFRYDFMCRGVDGSFFIVEVQSNPEKFWFKRCVSYASRVYDRQNRRGEEYDVPPVFLIGLMGIEVKHENPELWKERYVSEYSFREKLTNELPDDTIFIIFAELRRFKKQLHECENDLENQPQELQDEIFTRLFDACDIPRFDEDKRIQYDKDMFDERRYNGEIAAAREEGHMVGLSKGRADMCRAMLEKGISKETVAEIADLTVAELDEMLCQY